MKEIVMTALLLMAVTYDVRYRKIPNNLVLVGLAMCLVIQLWLAGFLGIRNSLIAFLITIAICWPLFLIGAIGAGDIKLLALVGAMYNLNFLFLVVVVLLVLAAIVSFVVLYRRGLFRQRMRYALSYFVTGRVKGSKYYDKRRDGTEVTIILAPFTAVAYAVVLIGKWGGLC